jgi:hypothetical protein
LDTIFLINALVSVSLRENNAPPVAAPKWFLSRGTKPCMIEVLNQKPVFHATVQIGSDVFLHMFPSLRNRLISLLLKTRDFVAKSIGVTHQEELNRESIIIVFLAIYNMTVRVEPLFHFSQ